MIRNLAASAILATCVAVGTAHADGHEGPYFGGALGASIASDFDFKASNANSQTRTLEFDTAPAFLGQIGYDFGDVRGELEIGYRHLGVESVSSGTNPAGDIGAYSIMVNGAYDFDTGSDWTPYVGLGAGALIAWGDVSYNDSNGTLQDKNVYGVAPAAQLGIGTAFAVSEDVDLTAGYGLLGALSDDGNEDNTILIHSLTAGFRFNF